MKEFIIFTNRVKKYPCWINVNGSVATLHFTSNEIPQKVKMRGFKWYYVEGATPSDYSEFSTVHRYDSKAGIYQMSNDGSVYVEPPEPEPIPEQEPDPEPEELTPSEELVSLTIEERMDQAEECLMELSEAIYADDETSNE